MFRLISAFFVLSLLLATPAFATEVTASIPADVWMGVGFNVGSPANDQGEGGGGYIVEVGGDIGFYVTAGLSLVALGEVGPRIGDNALLLDLGGGLRWRPGIPFEVLGAAAYFGAFGNRNNYFTGVNSTGYFSGMGGLAKLTYFMGRGMGPYLELKASTLGASAVLGVSLAF